MNGFNDARIKNNNASAQKYLFRKFQKHKAEMELLKKSVQKLAGVQSFLDAPCGYGRASKELIKLGYTATAVDLGDAILSCAHDHLKDYKCKIQKADLRELPFKDCSFDATLCFRYFHHLSNDQSRRIIIDELCRVSKKYVLISYLSAYSVTNIKRRIRVALNGRKSSQNSTKKRLLDVFFTSNGFEPVSDHAQTPFFHSLHLAIYKRTETDNASL